MRMYVIAVVVVVLIAGLLYLLDRGLKAVQRGRRRRDVAIRMATATDYAEKQAERSTEVSSALTSVLPAIQQPGKGPRRVA